MNKRHFLGFTPDGRRRYACDYGLPPIAGAAPDTSNDQIDASTDDAYEGELAGAMDLTDVSVIVRSNADGDWRWWGGVRFHNGPFPAKESTVDVAYLEVDVTSSVYDDANFDIFAEDGAGPATFTEAAWNISGRARTAASVPWVADAVGAGWKQSPSIVSVIQELVDDYDSTAIVLILKPKTDLTKHFRFYSWDEATHVKSAKLHLEWTTAGPQTFYQSVGGTLATAGVLSRMASISPAGTLASTGGLVPVDLGKKALAGTLAFCTPSSSDDQTDASLDDADQSIDSGSMCLVGYAVVQAHATYPFIAGLRFHNGPFPDLGATITAAYIELNAYNPLQPNINADIYAQDAANPLAFEDILFNISDRAKTTASVPWVEDGLSGWEQSPSLVAVIQELVDSYSLTAIVVLFDGRTDIYKRLELATWDVGPDYAPKLHLEWTASGGLLSPAVLWYRSLGGTLASTGYLASKLLVGVTYKTLTGVLTSSGALVRKTGYNVAGTFSSVGAVLKQKSHGVAGTLTSAGAVAGSLWQPKALAGTLSSAGTLVPKAGKALSGVLSSSGAMSTTLYKFITPVLLQGTLALAGALGGIKLGLQSLAGTFASAGAVATMYFRTQVMGGTATFAATLARATKIGVGGTLAPVGSITKKTWQAVAGAFAAVGALVARLWGPGKVIEVAGSVDTTIEAIGSVDTVLEVEGSDDTTIDVKGSM